MPTASHRDGTEVRAPPHRVVVVGGGFGGLHAVERLRRLDVEVTLVDRRNFHLFQPLTYQVATGALSPGEVAYPLRAVFKSSPRVRVLLAEVEGFDLAARAVLLAADADGGPSPPLRYDTLIVAAGSSYSYFGHEHWSEFAPEVKSLESALRVRSQVLGAFERAEREPAAAARDADLTFVVVGGGPTGVEMAGQIGEMAHDTLRRDFRTIDSSAARILLVEAADRLLTAFPPSLSAKAARSLEQLGVTPTLNRTVVDVDAHSVTLQDPGGLTERVAARTVIWAAGVRASPLGALLATAAGAAIDGAGRVTVERDLTLAGHPEVLVIGDMVRVRDAGGAPVALPGVAPVAIQQGRYAARLIADRLRGQPAAPFRYHDKGNVATIGRGHAVADLGRIRLSGVVAWLVWLLVHLYYLIGVQNRLLVLIRWTFSFATHGRGARLITGRAEPPHALEDAGRTPAHVG